MTRADQNTSPWETQAQTCPRFTTVEDRERDSPLLRFQPRGWVAGDEEEGSHGVHVTESCKEQEEALNRAWCLPDPVGFPRRELALQNYGSMNGVDMPAKPSVPHWWPVAYQ